MKLILSTVVLGWIVGCFMCLSTLYAQEQDTAIITSIETVSLRADRIAGAIVYSASEIHYTTKKLEIANYIHKINKRADAMYLADLFIEVCEKEYGQDPWLWVYIAQFESTFDLNARGEANERGLTQIHPVHKPRFPSYGLDWDCPEDQLRFGCCMFSEAKEHGASDKAAIKPWSVRHDAWRLYQRRK